MNFFLAVSVYELDSFLIGVWVSHLKSVQQFIVVGKWVKEAEIFMRLWTWKDAYETICLWKLFSCFYQNTDITSCELFQNLILVWISIEVIVGESRLLLLPLFVQLWAINGWVEPKRGFAWKSVRLWLMLTGLTCVGGYVELLASGCQSFWVGNGTERHMVAHNPEHLAYLGENI